MLNIRVYGTKAGLEWRQEFPNELVVKYADKPRETWRRGNGYIGEQGKKFTRIPAGHPEGYLEAFANIYQEAFRAIEAELKGQPQPKDLDYPDIDDGVYGMAFIETVVKSSKLGAKWVKFPKA
jgi:predicted dehydrogenase